MFPRRLRKSPPTLLALAEKSVQTWLIKYLRLDKGTFGSSVRFLRDHIDRQLIPSLQTRVLRSLVPCGDGGDGWKYSCQEAKKTRLACRAHRECKLVYKW